MTKKPRNTYAASPLLQAALHREWMSDPASRARRVDRRLKIAWLTFVVVCIAAGALGAQLALAWLVLTCAGVGISGSMVLIGWAWHLYRADLERRFEARLDEGGVFLICVHCGYDLRGGPPPRDTCPECGQQTWRLPRHAAALPGEGEALQETDLAEAESR